MQFRRSKFAIAAILTLTLLLSACSQGQITQSISVAITAAEIAIPLVGGSTGVDPKILSAATDYLQAANTALEEVTVILNSGEPAAVQAAKITRALSLVASANLPPGTPQVIADAVSKVTTAIIGVLSNFATNGKPKLMSPSMHYKFTSADKKALADAQAKLAKNRAALAKLKK